MTIQEVDQMKSLFQRFVKDQSGATAIEYGLIAALIAVAAIATMTSLGSNLKGKFQDVSDNLK
jgi:pilus assembly protein Flp/PilA